jgi:galactose mutarotase-like enzyme
VVRLFDRRRSRDWLRPPSGDETAVRAYGSSYTQSDHGGWDEMFPTVDACEYPGAPYAGVAVPDHGEVWALDWQIVEMDVDTDGARLTQRVEGRHFAYVLERRLTLTRATVLATYRCEVAAASTFLWALHPQFAARPGTRLELDPAPRVVLDTSSPEDAREVDWPGDFVIERDVAPGGDRMLYVRADERASAATLVDRTGETLRVSWDSRFAPYLGLWADYGRFTEGSVIAVEPTNGFYDELRRAAHAGRLASMSPAAPTTWWVEITVGGEKS